MEKKHLNFKVSATVYDQLKSDIGKGKIGDFIEKLIIRELGGVEKRAEQEYRECYANLRLMKEAKQWEKAETKSWLDYESNEQGKAKK